MPYCAITFPSLQKMPAFHDRTFAIDRVEGRPSSEAAGAYIYGRPSFEAAHAYLCGMQEVERSVVKVAATVDGQEVTVVVLVELAECFALDGGPRRLLSALYLLLGEYADGDLCHAPHAEESAAEIELVISALRADIERTTL